jgi:uncharacterized protein (DUF1499 family)
MLTWVLAAILSVLLILFLAGLLSACRRPETGLVDGRLRPCSRAPNCVCSEAAPPARGVPPLAFAEAPEEAWDWLRHVVQDQGGRVEKETDRHLWATFRSRIFRFVDDLECRLDPDERRIHVRSASRLAWCDLGANRRRVEALREAFARGRQDNSVESREASP